MPSKPSARPAETARPSPLPAGLPYALFYGAVFLALGVYLPFWPVWMKDRGLGPSEIGLILALASWVRIFSTPMIGQAADRSQRAKTVLCLLALGSLVSFVCLHWLNGFWALLWFNLLAALLLQAMIPLGESLAMTATKSGGVDYGRVRLWGSLTFILGTVGTGWLLGGEAAPGPLGPSGVLWLVVAGLALTLAACLTIPRGTGASRAPDFASLGSLLADRGFLVFLVASGLLQASHGFYYGFSALHWQAAGLGGSWIGVLWAVGVIAEVVLFIYARSVVDWLGPVRLLMIAGAGGILRWSVLATTTDIPALLAVQTLHAATFGAAHLGAMYFLAQRAPLGLAATAQSLYTAVSGGLATGGTILLSGLLYDRFGGGGYVPMALASLLGLILASRLPKTAGVERSDV